MTRAFHFISKTKKRLTLTGAIVVALAAALVAVAYWTSAGAGSGSAITGSLSAPVIATATPGAGTVTLDWSPGVTPPGTGTVTYYVTRDGDDAGGDCATFTSTTTATSCTDSGLAAGTYHYAVTAMWRTWTAASATSTVTVTTGTSITLSPTSGNVGSTVSISGSGFTASSSVSATYDGGSVALTPATSTSGTGSFSGATFTVPTSTAGSHTVHVTAGATSATASFTVTPKITITPTSGHVGDTVTVSGTGFGGTQALSATFGGSSVSLSGTTTTGANGSFTGATLAVPANTAGAHSVAITDAAFNTNSASYTVTPKITLSPTTGNVGDSVTISGTGFAAASSVTATYAVSSVSLSPATSTNANGSFSGASFTVPASTAGPHTVTATDASSNSDSATFTVTPKITLSPSTGNVGDTVTITGTGYAGTSTINATYSGVAIGLTPLSPVTNTTGAFSATFPAPASTAGVHTVVATDGASNNAGASFTVTPKITLSPATANVGDTVTISGTGFAGTSSISATYGGSAVTLSPATSTNASGSFSGATFTVPASTAGAHTVTASDAATNSASASFTVTPKITLSPTSGNVGVTVTISGTGFAGSSSISATYAGSSITLSPATSTNASGSFSGATFTVPASAAGAHTVTASDASSNSGSASYTVTSSVTGLSPTSGTVGTTGVTISASGFIASHALTVTVGGNSAAITSGGTTNANGSSTVTFTIPAAPNGARAVVVSDGTNSLTSATNFTIQQSATGLSPTSGTVGTTGVTISASGFIASHALTVTVGGNAATITSGGTTDANGSSTVTFTIPAAPNGARTVVVSDGTNPATSATNFTIQASATGLSPTTGAAGTTGVTINAAGFIATHVLTVTVGGTSATITSGGTSDANGGSTVTFTIPLVAAGAQPVVVSDGTNSATSATNFTVTSTVFGATDLGNTAAAPDTTITANTAAGPSVTTTSGRAELIFIHVRGANAGSATTVASIAGPFTSASQVAGFSYAATDYEFVWKAVGSGAGPTAVTVTFNSATTSAGATVVDVVQLSAGNAVLTCSSCTNSGSGTAVAATLTVQNANDTEVGFYGIAAGKTFTGPTNFTQLANAQGNGTGTASYATACDANVQSSATATAAGAGSWGAIGIEISASPSDCAPTPTSLAIANKTGGTASKPEAGDTITIVFSKGLSVSSLCSSWTNDAANQSLSDATVQFTQAGATDSIAGTPTTPTCSGGFHLGGITTNGDYVTANTLFGSSTIAWNATTFTLKITLGAVTGTDSSRTASAGNHTATYTPDPSITSILGTQVTGTAAVSAVLF